MKNLIFTHIFVILQCLITHTVQMTIKLYGGGGQNERLLLQWQH